MIDKMSNKDKKKVIQRYSKRYEKFGYSSKTLGWDKGKQDLRYSMLFEGFNLENKRILDIGCGFADANNIIQQKTSNYQYFGIDIVEVLINEAKSIYKDKKNIKLFVADFLTYNFEEEFDIIIASGVFNFKLIDRNNYEFIQAFLEKAFDLSKEGIAFDFLSNKVDFEYEDTFHSDPTKILELGYNLSKNLILKNHYMPFEFSLTVYKDESFNTDDTIFKRFKNEECYYRFH